MLNSSPSTTPSDDPRELWCLPESDDVIMVNMKANDYISTLKEKVHEKVAQRMVNIPKI